MPEARYLAGCCGVYCGLCPGFQTEARNRCIGCHLGDRHSHCTIRECCVVEHGYHTCSECSECPCDRLTGALRAGVGADGVFHHGLALDNLDRLSKVGMERYLEQQEEKRSLLEHLLGQYNEGRSTGFYCLACALMSAGSVQKALGWIDTRLERRGVKRSDLDGRAREMRAILRSLASENGVVLESGRGH